MAIEIIDKLKQKNNGNFKLMDAKDVAIGDSDVESKFANVDSEQSNLKDSLGALNNNLNAQKTRLDNLAKLKEGSTTGDAEIIDARVKSDGTSYSKLGDRLNEVDSQLEHKVNKDCATFNVKDFGIETTYNNKIDKTIAIENSKKLQELINYCEDNFFTATIVFPTGITQLMPGIKFRKGINIKGSNQPADIFISPETYMNGSIICDVSDIEDTTDLFTWKNETEGAINRIFGVHIENIKIEGRYQKHNAINMFYTGFNSRIDNVTIRRFLGSALHLSKVYDTVMYGLSIAECGGDFNDETKYALEMNAYDNDKTNAQHIYGLHIEHCHYAIKLVNARQIEFIGGKYERGNVYNYNNDNSKPSILISNGSQEITFIGLEFITNSVDSFNANYTSNEVPYLVEIENVENKSRTSRKFIGCNFICSGNNSGANFIKALDSNTVISNSYFVNANINVKSIQLDGESNLFVNNHVAFMRDNFDCVGLYTNNSTVKDNYFSCGIHKSGCDYIYAINGNGNSVLENNKIRNSDFTNVYNINSTNLKIKRIGTLTVNDNNIQSIIEGDTMSAYIDFNKLKYPYEQIRLHGLTIPLTIIGFKNTCDNDIFTIHNHNATDIITIKENSSPTLRLSKQLKDSTRETTLVLTNNSNITFKNIYTMWKELYRSIY